MTKTIPYKKMGRPSRRPDPEFLITLYETHTATEIGKMYDVSPDTVRSWVSRLRKEYAQQSIQEEQTIDE